MTTSVQAVRLPIEDVEAAGLARSGGPAEQRVPAQQEDGGGHGVLERAEVDGFGDGHHGRAGPGDRVGVRVVVQHPQLEPVGQVVGGGVDAARWPANSRSQSASCVTTDLVDYTVGRITPPRRAGSVRRSPGGPSINAMGERSAQPW